MISIELISRGEGSLKDVLDSIMEQNFKDIEIVCADASSNPAVKELLLDHGCKVIDIPQNTGHLKARFIAHQNATGEKSLILDSTRPLKRNALNVLFTEYYKSDMVIIKEDCIGEGFWVKQARIIKDISDTQILRNDNETLAFLLPRFYNSSVLTKAFLEIYTGLGDLFDEVSYGEHHLIFEACKKFSNNVCLTKETLISHYEDDSLIKIINKYYRYGKMQKVLKYIPNSAVNDFSSHRRKGINLMKKFQCLPIVIARGIPFLIGYIF